MALAAITPSHEPEEGLPGGPNLADCSHFCSHLVDFGPANPVTAGLFKPTTANLLNSRSMVRIHQGAFQSGA